MISPELLPVSQVPAIGHRSLHRFPATRKARPQQTGGKGAFVAGLQIYVNLLDFKGAWLIYPPRPASVGLNVINLKDADGKSLIQDIIRTARDNGEGWVEYRWINPVTNRVEPKLTYVKRVAGKDIAASIGIYK